MPFSACQVCEIMINQRRNNLKKTALYEAWKDAIKRARAEYNFMHKYKIKGEYPLDPSFADFDLFALVYQLDGYVIGRDDDKVIARYDISKPFSFSNCHFVDRKEYIDELQYIEEKVHKESIVKTLKNKKETHGLSKSRLYSIWKGMVRRCTDVNCKDYKDYGGRGIQVCNDWKCFLDFYTWAWEHGYSTDSSIDRIDVNGDYCPDNCRWSSDLEQKLNTRYYNGKYRNVRLKAKDMLDLVSKLDPNCVVTLIARSDMLPHDIRECDFPSVPEQYRIDIK